MELRRQLSHFIGNAPELAPYEAHRCAPPVLSIRMIASGTSTRSGAVDATILSKVVLNILGHYDLGTLAVLRDDVALTG